MRTSSRHLKMVTAAVLAATLLVSPAGQAGPGDPAPTNPAIGRRLVLGGAAAGAAAAVLRSGLGPGPSAAVDESAAIAARRARIFSIYGPRPRATRIVQPDVRPDLFTLNNRSWMQDRLPRATAVGLSRTEALFTLIVENLREHSLPAEALTPEEVSELTSRALAMELEVARAAGLSAENAFAAIDVLLGPDNLFSLAEAGAPLPAALDRLAPLYFSEMEKRFPRIAADKAFSYRLALEIPPSAPLAPLFPFGNSLHRILGATQSGTRGNFTFFVQGNGGPAGLFHLRASGDVDRALQGYANVLRRLAQMRRGLAGQPTSALSAAAEREIGSLENNLLADLRAFPENAMGETINVQARSRATEFARSRADVAFPLQSYSRQISAPGNLRRASSLDGLRDMLSGLEDPARWSAYLLRFAQPGETLALAAEQWAVEPLPASSSVVLRQQAPERGRLRFAPSQPLECLAFGL